MKITKYLKTSPGPLETFPTRESHIPKGRVFVIKTSAPNEQTVEKTSFLAFHFSEPVLGGVFHGTKEPPDENRLNQK